MNEFKKIIKSEKTRKFMYNLTLFSLFLAISFTPIMSYASATEAGQGVIKSNFKNIWDIVTTIISSIGSLVLLWGFFEFGISLNSSDGTAQSNAFKKIGGGLICVLAPQIVSTWQA